MFNFDYYLWAILREKFLLYSESTSSRDEVSVKYKKIDNDG
jgi:hypothetical protein